MFLKNSIYEVKLIFTDEGKEFTSKSMIEIYNKYNVKRYSTYQRDIKVSIVERFNRTLKEKISRYVVEFNTERFIDKLDVMINTYNLTEHRGLMNKSPTDVYLMSEWDDVKEFTVALYKNHFRKNNSVQDVLTHGEVVRVKNVSHHFKRSYHLKNSYELFKIDKVNQTHVPITYMLKELDGEKIHGIFYRSELIKVNDSGKYAVNIIKKRRRKGKEQYLIKYVHYPGCKEQWVDSKQIEKLI